MKLVVKLSQILIVVRIFIYKFLDSLHSDKDQDVGIRMNENSTQNIKNVPIISKQELNIDYLKPKLIQFMTTFNLDSLIESKCTSKEFSEILQKCTLTSNSECTKI